MRRKSREDFAQKRIGILGEKRRSRSFRCQRSRRHASFFSEKSDARIVVSFLATNQRCLNSSENDRKIKKKKTKDIGERGNDTQ